MTETIDIPGNQNDETQPVEVVLDGGEGTQRPAPKLIPEAEGIEDLKAQVAKAREESRKRLTEADRLIKEAHDRATKAEQETTETKRDVVANVIDRLAIEKDAARRDFIAAVEASDPTKQADAQERMAIIAARIVEAEKGRLALEEEIKTPRQAPQPQSRVSQDDPVDDVASRLEQGGAPRSAAWLRAHPEYATPGKLNDAMTKAHYYALSEGHAPETDGYFEMIDQRLGLNDPAPARGKREAANSAPVSAPVSRNTSVNGRRGDPQRVTLTSDEVLTAKAIGMSPEDYAKELVQLGKEGKGRLASYYEGRN